MKYVQAHRPIVKKVGGTVLLDKMPQVDISKLSKRKAGTRFGMTKGLLWPEVVIGC